MRTKHGVLFSLLTVLLVLPHLSFRFGPKEKALPPPHWIEAQNRDAFQVWEYARPASDPNFIFVPLQDTRKRALLDDSMVFKIPALPKEEEVPALNALKASLFENRKHQVEIKYEELLLKNSGLRLESDLDVAARRYSVKVKKTELDNPKNFLKFKKKIVKQFKLTKDSFFRSWDENQETAGLSGFSLKGSWRDAFDPASTREGTFGTQEVPMMLKAGYHGYFEEDQFQALDLRYGDGKVSLMIFLPRAEVNLETFYKELNFENWNQWMAAFIERQGSVRIPRFKIETFSEECCHVAVFETGEKGGRESFRYDMTEVLGTEDHFEFDANRPFFFAVRDNETDLILLMGQYTGAGEARILPA